MPTAAALETKTTPGRGLEIKASADGWEISGFASTFSAPDAPKSSADAYGDLVMRGAFKSAVADPSRVKFCLEHGPVIGTTLELRETPHGLYGRWSIVDTTAGTDAHKLAKAGALDALSIGFFADEATYRDDHVRLLTGATLVEVSIVGSPANSNAVVTSVKSASANGASMPTAPARAPVDMAALGARLAHLGIEVGAAPSGGSLGRRCVEHPDVKAVMAGTRQSAVVDGFDVRTLLSNTTGSIPDPPALRPDLMVPATPPTFLQLIRQEAATSGSVSVPFSSGLSGAAGVLEATASAGASGLKPEGSIGWTAAAVPLGLVAVWVPTTTRALQDPVVLEQLLSGELRQAVLTKLEADVLQGSGVAPEMTGLWNTAGATEVVATGVGNALSSIARAIGRVGESGRPCTVVAIAAASYSAILEASAATLVGQALHIAGVPIIPTLGLTAGRALAGAGATAVLWARPLSVTVGMVGVDFSRNLRRVLGEVEAVVVDTRPTSWCRVSGLPS